MKIFFPILCLTLLIFGCGSGSNSESDSGILSKKEFTLDFLEKLKKKYPSQNYKMTKELEIQSIQNDGGMIKNLENAYVEYRKNPKKMDQVFDHYSIFANKTYDDLEQDIEVSIDKIVPIIKHRNFIKQISEQFGGNEHFLVYEEYNNELIILYSIDNPKTIIHLNHDQFATMDVDFEGLRKAAMNNLYSIISEDLGFEEKDGLFNLRAGNFWESSMILFPALWKKENFGIKGDIIISIPNRGTVLIMDSQDKEKALSLKMATKTLYRSGQYSISDKMFKWDPDTQIFDPIR